MLEFELDQNGQKILVYLWNCLLSIEIKTVPRPVIKGPPFRICRVFSQISLGCIHRGQYFIVVNINFCTEKKKGEGEGEVHQAFGLHTWSSRGERHFSTAEPSIENVGNSHRKRTYWKKTTLILPLNTPVPVYSTVLRKKLRQASTCHGVRIKIRREVWKAYNLFVKKVDLGRWVKRLHRSGHVQSTHIEVQASAKKSNNY